MALTDENGGMVMPVQPLGGYGYGMPFGNNGGLFGNGGDSWLGILFLIALCNGGWGGFGGFGMGGMLGAGMWGMDMLYPWLNNSQNINDGFRDQQLATQVSGIQNAVTSGFGDVQTALCNGFAGTTAAVTGAQNALSQQMYSNQLADLERSFAAQTASTQGMNAIQSQLAQCCCDNRAATADLKYTVATENCADRAALSDGLRDVIASNTAQTQAILDKLCALELDGVKNQLAQAQRENLGLQNQLNIANLAASQIAQTDSIIDGTYNRLKNCPVGSTPVWGNSPIFQCPTNVNTGCGCGGF